MKPNEHVGTETATLKAKLADLCTEGALLREGSRLLNQQLLVLDEIRGPGRDNKLQRLRAIVALLQQEENGYGDYDPVAAMQEGVVAPLPGSDDDGKSLTSIDVSSVGYFFLSMREKRERKVETFFPAGARERHQEPHCGFRIRVL